MRLSHFLFAAICASVCQAQVEALRTRLIGLPNDTTRLPVLTELVRATVFTEPDVALAHAQQYTEIARQAVDTFHIAKGENFQGMCYATRSDYDEAMVHYTRALDLFEHIGDVWYTAMLHNNIGGVLIEQGHLQGALDRFQLARRGFTAMRDTIWTANVLNNIGNIHQERGAHDSSAVIYRRAAGDLDAIGQSAHAASAWLNLGNSYTALGDIDGALAAYEAALQRTAYNEDDHTRTMAFLGKGRTLMALGRMNEARTALDSGWANAHEMRILQQIARAHEDLAEWFERVGRPDSALHHQRLFSQWRDSVFTVEKLSSITEMQEKYESDKKDMQLKENEAQLNQRSFTIKAIATGALLLLLVALFALRAYRVKRRGEAELARKNAIIEAQLKEKELLVREIHHRVKNNLQTVSSLLSIQGRGITDEKAKEAVNDSRLRVKSMALIHQDLYREGDLTGVRMKEYVQKLAGSLISSYDRVEQVSLKCQVEDLDLDVDTAVPIGLILNELITNALKYAWPNAGPGILTIRLGRVDDTLHIAVEDNGVGYDAQATRSAESTGFGWGMIRTFATKLKAQWSVRSDSGTVVELVIRNFHLARG
ncbi:MAG: tetratricopeptide repeat protein [Flavobacteriales bacterium]|nr:tetratricopeptide repeat protein [Flavobacteriales bacterium]